MNPIIKKVISVFILLILLCCVSSSLGILIYITKSECSDEYKCINKLNKCIDIPLYYTRNSDGKCKLTCANDDRCIKDDSCIEIPRGFQKDINNYCIQGSISNISGNISGNRSGNISGNISGNRS
jgi:hypothetical protein